MSNAVRTVELLRIIADTVGVEGRTCDGGDPEATPAANHRAVLLFRLIKAFRALPDGGTRLQALQFVEGLAAQSASTK